MGKITGYDFTIWVGTGETKTVLGGSKTVAFKDAYEKIDTSSRDGIDFVLAPGSYTLSANGVADFTATGGTNSKSIMQIYKAKSIVNWQFGLAQNSDYPQVLNTGATYMYGTAKILNLSFSSDYKGTLDYDMQFDSVGDWNYI